MNTANCCENCIHADVCKYTETLESIKSELVDTLFEVICKKFQSKKPLPVVTIGETTSTPGPTRVYDYHTGTVREVKGCEDCDWAKSDHSDYVGDAPCQWCEHSPTRVTCNISSIYREDSDERRSSETLDELNGVGK